MQLNTLKFLLTGLALCAWAGAAPAASSEADLKKLQGTWSGVSHSSKDKAEQERIRRTTMVVKDDSLKLLHKERSDEVYQILKLDPSQKPKTIDLRRDNDTVQAIYAFEGDTVKIAINKDVDGRPARFDAGTQSILVFRRKK